MYAKLLKENAFGLSLLVIANDAASRETVGINLSGFFKRITFTTDEAEACQQYATEKYDLILIDIDTFDGEICRFIDKMHRYDLFQAFAVCSSRTDDSDLMLKLLNSQIACFIPKPSERSSVYQILSKVCSKVQDRAILMHYIETLERQHEKAISVSCKASCPMKAELKPIEPHSVPYAQTMGAVQSEEEGFVFFADSSSATAAQEDEDDFMFFPDLSSISRSVSEGLSVYQDYFMFLESDDREELYDQLGDIDAALLSAFSGEPAPRFIERLGNSLMRYGNVLLHYQFFSDMGTSILELGKIIGDEAEMIASRADELQLLISGFCSGLQTYMNEVWDKNCDNPKIFNDSIINDAATIMGIIAPAEAAYSDDLVFF